MKKISFRKNHFVIEFLSQRRDFWIYAFKRLLAFLVDITFYLAFVLLFDLIFKFSIINNLFLSYFVFLFYLLLNILIFKNKTLGLLLGGLIIGSYDGSKVSNKEKWKRIIFISLYTLPIIGVILLLASLLNIIFNKGLSWIDLFSKSQIFSRHYYYQVSKIYHLIEKERS